VGDVGVAEERASLWSLPVGQEDTCAFGIGPQAVAVTGPPGVNDFGDREAVVGIKDGGLKKVAPGKLAPAVVEFGPAVDDAGTVTESMPSCGISFDTFGREVVNGQTIGAPSRWH
jgi:hypothetical protein